MAVLSSSPDPFRCHRLVKPEEFRAAAELSLSASHLFEGRPLSAGLLQEIQDHGGLVVGSFVNIHLAGLAVTWVGWQGQAPYWYSPTLVVRPEYRHHGVGRRLTSYVREEARIHGVTTLRSTIDPLSSRSARFVFAHPGTVPERYLLHYFGQNPSDVGPNEEMDRVSVAWDMTQAVLPSENGVIGTLPLSPEGMRPWIETELSEGGFHRPTVVHQPTPPYGTLEIPFDMDSIRQQEPALVRPWRYAVREVFVAALQEGYRFMEFRTVSWEHERRCFYLFSSPSR